MKDTVALQVLKVRQLHLQMIFTEGGFLRQIVAPSWNPEHPWHEFAEQLCLDQSREFVRSWKKCYPTTSDQEIVDRTRVITGLDVSMALPDPGPPILLSEISECRVERANHGRVTCAIVIVRDFFHGRVQGAEDVLAKCLQDWKDFDIFRLCWVLIEAPPMTHARAFEQLAAAMGLIGPIKPLYDFEVGPAANRLASLGHAVVQQ